MGKFRVFFVTLTIISIFASIDVEGQTYIGGVGTYNLSGFGIGFQVAIKENNKISYQTRLMDNWGNKNKIAYQTYEFGAGISYKIFKLEDELSLLIGASPIVSYQRQSDEDSNILQQFNYGGNASLTVNINTANNSIFGITLSKAIYGKHFIAVEDIRLGIAYSFY
ncbi:hypothetical protein [Pedobacter jeongneungensis]|uniref:hypothetical protein n=1 Tax=Pedobacter jeongneungensis TaxID=947309 RepID=UPI00046AAE62|nr:hypothetical protein [Pedobacter jeongneungensis]